MEYKKLIIGTIIEKNNRIVLGTSFYTEKAINWSRKKAPKEIEKLCHQKKLNIIGA